MLLARYMSMHVISTGIVLGAVRIRKFHGSEFSDEFY